MSASARRSLGRAGSSWRRKGRSALLPRATPPRQRPGPVTCRAPRKKLLIEPHIILRGLGRSHIYSSAYETSLLAKAGSVGSQATVEITMPDRQRGRAIGAFLLATAVAGAAYGQATRTGPTGHPTGSNGPATWGGNRSHGWNGWSGGPHIRNHGQGSPDGYGRRRPAAYSHPSLDDLLRLVGVGAGIAAIGLTARHVIRNRHRNPPPGSVQVVLGVDPGRVRLVHRAP